MTQASIVLTRLALWQRACEFWGFQIDPPLTRETLAAQPLGSVSIFAERAVALGGDAQRVTLSVVETWLPGADPLGDRRLEREGCHVSVLSWHLQIGAEPGPAGAERLDIVPTPDAMHPRIHRHPYGEPNHVRLPAELPPPHVWLHELDGQLGGLLGETAGEQSRETR
jgi:hypothetical protein